MKASKDSRGIQVAGSLIDVTGRSLQRTRLIPRPVSLPIRQSLLEDAKYLSQEASAITRREVRALRKPRS